jgi:hypothetical protein
VFWEPGPDPSGSGKADCVLKASGSSVDSAKDCRKDQSIHFPLEKSSRLAEAHQRPGDTDKPTQVCLK